MKPNCLAVGMGSVPLADCVEGMGFVRRFFPAIPNWPQLPRTGFKDNMYAQYSEGFPGMILDETNQRLHVDTEAFMESVEGFFERYLGGNPEYFRMSREFAAGLYEMMKTDLSGAVGVKGQVTGPVSFGMQVVDENKRCIAYNDSMREVLTKFLQMKARWQEVMLRRLNPNTIIFLDEPYLSAFGSAYFNLDRETVTGMLGEVLSGVEGLKGVHCCGNTDWSLLLESPIDILSFDAYGFGHNFSLYSDDAAEFLKKDKMIAWGIVPTNADDIRKTSREDLLKRFDACLGSLVDKGLDKRFILERSFITPACGVGGESKGNAARVLELTAEVSAALREEYAL
ncbi:MAG: methionine synthase [archaeon]